jgi:enoyl-CoA hydratase
VPFAELEARVLTVARQLASIPLSQLSAMKLIVNQAYENMGLASTQTLGPILDGLMRNTPGRGRLHRAGRKRRRARSHPPARRRVRRLQPGARDQQPNPDNIIKP